TPSSSTLTTQSTSLVLHPLILSLTPAPSLASSLTHPPPPHPHPLSLHDALPIFRYPRQRCPHQHPGHRDHDHGRGRADHRGAHEIGSTRLNSSHVSISYAVFCLKKKNKKKISHRIPNISINTITHTRAKPRTTAF